MFSTRMLSMLNDGCATCAKPNAKPRPSAQGGALSAAHYQEELEAANALLAIADPAAAAAGAPEM